MKFLVISLFLALGFFIGFAFWDEVYSPPDGRTEFQVKSITSDRQGLETLHYISTTDGRILRFNRKKVEWVAVKVDCTYSTDEFLHIDDVPVITNVKEIGCVG